jgi:uncharacterized protein
VTLWGNSLGGAHAISVAAHDPRIVAVVAQIPFNGFPRRVEGRSTGAATEEADHHIQTLTGGDATTRWKNEVAPRGSSR